MTTALQAPKPPPTDQLPEKKKAATFKEFIESHKGALAQVATKHLSAEKLIKMLGFACSRQPKLLDCTPLSMLNAAMTCAELGLAPGTLSRIHLIPFKNGKTGKTECQVIVDYKGLVELARRSGTIMDISADVVRQGDEFSFKKGLEPKLDHIPSGDPSRDKNPITHAWCVVHFKDGGAQFEVMTKNEIDQIRSQSKAGGNGPWVNHYAEMAKKTVVRRIAKMLPLTPEVEEQISKVDATEFTFTDLGDADEDGQVGGTNLDAAKKAAELAAGQTDGATKPADETNTRACQECGKPSSEDLCDKCLAAFQESKRKSAGVETNGADTDISEQMKMPSGLLGEEPPNVGTVDRRAGNKSNKR